MAGYRVVCVTTEDPHGHIVSIGTAGGRGVPDWQWPGEDPPSPARLDPLRARSRSVALATGRV